jgi:glycosyltransferase involved in cell wall biosynthesis
MKELPSVSVIVPAHNEAAFIGRCIASIRGTRWPAELLEIIVVDNRSTDRTAELARGAGARVIQQDSGRIGAIRNAGLKAAGGDVVAFVDGDCTVRETWLHAAVELLHQDARVGAVGGPCLSPREGTWVERSLAPDRLDWNGVRPAESLATSSFISRSALLKQVGMFNEHLLSGEDDEMSRRIREQGFLLYSASACHVVHYGYPASWLAVLGKQMWHGSNQLETRAGLDPTLWISHLFLLATVAVAALVPLLAAAPSPLRWAGVIASIGAWCIGPGFFVAKKLRRDPWTGVQIGRWFLVGIAYFAGRSIGLLQNYWRKLTQR